MADDLSAYGMPDTTGYVTQPPRQIQPPQPQENAYGVNNKQAPQSGPFDSVPFHKWLADNAKTKYKTDPWNLNDDQINNAISDYANGPLRTVLGHQINQTRKFPSDKAREAALNDELGYYKMLAQQEISQSIPQIRGHFQSLKPADAAQQTTAPSGVTPQKTPVAPEYNVVDNPLVRGLAQAGNA